MKKQPIFLFVLFVFIDICTYLEARVPTQNIVKQQLEKKGISKRDVPMKNLKIPKTVQVKKTKKYKARRKPKTQYAEGRKTLRDMNYEEVKEAKNRIMKSGHKDIALKYLERMLKLCDDLSELASLLLEYANTHYECEHFAKAGNIYNEFVNLYPGSDKVEYALYQAIICSSKLILEPDRDQTKTHETIELCDKFLEREAVFTTYKTKVKEILINCYNNLVASELNVCDFFLKSGRYKPAQKRLDDLRVKWTDRVPNLEPRILAFECDLADIQNNDDIAQQKRTELEKHFPHYAMQIAENKKSKFNFSRRF